MLHALWNVVAKRSAGGPPFVILFGWVSAAIATPIMLWQWQTHPQAMTVGLVLAALSSALIHAAYSLVLQQGYRVSDFAVVYPIARGVGPMLAVIGSVLLFGETPSLSGWLGIALIVAGVFVTAGIQGIFSAEPSRCQTGVAWGSLTGAFIAIYTLLDGWAVKSLGATPVLFYGAVLWFRVLLFAPWAIRGHARIRVCWRENALAVILVGTLSPLAYVLVLFAVQLAPLAYIAPVREVSMLVAAFAGAKFLGESLSRMQILGAALMASGVLALALA